MTFSGFQRLKEKLEKRLGVSQPNGLDENGVVRTFKTEAWQSNASRTSITPRPKMPPQVFHSFADLYIDTVRRFSKPGVRILDLGCGSGLVSLALADLGYDVVSCDVSRDMLKFSSNRRVVASSRRDAVTPMLFQPPTVSLTW